MGENNFIRRLYKTMFKSITNGFSRFFTKQKITILIIFLILGWGLLYYSGQKTGIIDRFDDGTPVGAYPSTRPPVLVSQAQMPPSMPSVDMQSMPIDMQCLDVSYGVRRTGRASIHDIDP